MILSFVWNNFSSTGPSILLSKTSSNLFSGAASPMKAFLLLNPSGGRKIGSSPALRAFSSIFGMSLARSGLESSRHGFVLTSIKYGLNSSSIIKSRPNTSIQLSLLLGSSFPWHARNMSVEILFICVRISLSKLIFKLGNVLSMYS